MRLSSASVRGTVAKPRSKTTRNGLSSPSTPARSTRPERFQNVSDRTFGLERRLEQPGEMAAAKIERGFGAR